MSTSAASDSTCPTLLEQARRNDQAAWSNITRLYGPRVYAWARKAGLQEADAVDLGQDVFRVLAIKLPDFDRQRTGSFRNWLSQITHYVLSEHFRRARRFPATMAAVPSEKTFRSDDPADSEDVESERAFVHRLLAIIRSDFTDKTWDIFWRSTVEGHSSVELAAESVQRPRNTVETPSKPSNFSPDRQVAEMTFARGGTIRIAGDRATRYKQLSDLPAYSFQVTSLSLTDCPVTDDDPSSKV